MIFTQIWQQSSEQITGLKKGPPYKKQTGLWSSNVLLTAEKWTHIALVQDGNDIRIYINGVLENIADDCAVGVIHRPLTIRIGSIKGEKISNSFDGVIDEVAVYDRALSAEEIGSVMHRRLDEDEPNLIVYWNFDEGEEQVVHDLSGNGNNGYLGRESQGADSRDPYWVASDAPVGICTLQSLVERNLEDVLDMKTDALDILGAAISKEQAVLDMLNTSFKNRDFGTAKKGDVVKAKQNIMGAIQQEEQAETSVDNSIEKLIDAMTALDIEPDANSSP